MGSENRRNRGLGKEFAGYEQEYQLDSRGRKKRVLVYRGKYYRFDCQGRPLDQVKRRCGLLAGLSVGIYVALISLLPTLGVKSALVAALELIALVPACYLLLGLYSLCRAKEPVEEKIPLLSVQRLRRSSAGLLVCGGAVWAASLIYLIRLRPPVDKLFNDVLFLVGLAAVLVMQILLRRVLKPIRWEVVPKQEPKKTEKTE